MAKQSDFKVYTCNDFDYIQSVLFSDEMWERASDDYSIKDIEAIKNSGGLWLVCVLNGENIGLFCFYNEGNSAIEAHIHIEKKHRGRNTLMVGRSFLNWIDQNKDSRTFKINTKIPVIFKDVIIFAKRLGFSIEGIDTKSIMKNGKLIDRVCLGLNLKGDL